MTQRTGTGKYEQLLERCRSLTPVPTAVAHPCEESALEGAIDAGANGLIEPILVGPEAKIREIAAKKGLNLGSTRIVDAGHSHDSAAKAVALVRKGEAELLMKGSLHTDELLGAVVARDGYTHVGTGRSTILYSREAALAGISHTRPWRVLAWVDAAALQ